MYAYINEIGSVMHEIARYLSKTLSKLPLKKHSENHLDLHGCKIQFPAGFAKDTYSYDEYFERYGHFEYHQTWN